MQREKLLFQGLAVRVLNAYCEFLFAACFHLLAVYKASIVRLFTKKDPAGDRAAVPGAGDIPNTFRPPEFDKPFKGVAITAFYIFLIIIIIAIIII